MYHDPYDLLLTLESAHPRHSTVAHLGQFDAGRTRATATSSLDSVSLLWGEAQARHRGPDGGSGATYRGIENARHQDRSLNAVAGPRCLKVFGDYPPTMSTNYSSSSPSSASPSPLRVSAGTAVKIGFFGALGATLFSLILSAVASVVIIVLVLLGVLSASLFQVPR